MRTVQLVAPAMEALFGVRGHTALIGETVFLDPRTNRPFADDMVFRYRFWNPAVKKSGVVYREPKQMRHTYASMLLSSGEALQFVARQLGHSSVTTTERKYARWIPNDTGPKIGAKAVEAFYKGAGCTG